jgi:hypothetical protein
MHVESLRESPHRALLANFNPQRWLLCHVGLYQLEFEFELQLVSFALAMILWPF